MLYRLIVSIPFFDCSGWFYRERRLRVNQTDLKMQIK